MSDPIGDCEKKFSVIFVLGGPGCGKGTQCTNISKKYGYVHLSAGELLRDEVKNPESEDAKLITDHMKNGSIVPVEITCRLIERAMIKSGKSHFLIDGFPRNQNNLDGWMKEMSEKVAVQLVLYIECSDDICITRCLGRSVGGSAREDDNETTLKKRLVQFQRECKPIIDYFSEKNLVFTVNGNCGVDKVFEEIQTKLDVLQ